MAETPRTIGNRVAPARFILFVVLLAVGSAIFWALLGWREGLQMQSKVEPAVERGAFLPQRGHCANGRTAQQDPECVLGSGAVEERTQHARQLAGHRTARASVEDHAAVLGEPLDQRGLANPPTSPDHRDAGRLPREPCLERRKLGRPVDEIHGPTSLTWHVTYVLGE